ncbi:MAG: hypothetical protein EPN39_01215 [Chitinophagaceae bacterium]|nr:MAG: hypothetical protein EPN39_01215 [Chitinophagaceae bacterium]
MIPVDFLMSPPVRGVMGIGNIHDGGYAVYGLLLDKTRILLTYGAGRDGGFEAHFHRLSGKGVLMIDPKTEIILCCRKAPSYCCVSPFLFS